MRLQARGTAVIISLPRKRKSQIMDDELLAVLQRNAVTVTARAAGHARLSLFGWLGCNIVRFDAQDPCDDECHDSSEKAC